MAARVYYFTTRQAAGVPVYGFRDGIVAAIANLDDGATDAARLASLGVAAAAAGLRIPADYFANGVAVGATPALNLSVAFSAIFMGQGKILTGTGS